MVKKYNEEALESPAHPEAKSYREVLSGYNLEITTSYGVRWCTIDLWRKFPKQKTDEKLRFVALV